MRKYLITTTPTTPILLHADSVDWADAMKIWETDPDNADKAKPGEDRTPPWRWLGSLNATDFPNGQISIPAEYVMKCLMTAAAEIKKPKGRGTLKKLSQAAIICDEFHWPLLLNGQPIEMSKVWEAKTNPLLNDSFSAQVKHVRSLGFDLFVKRAGVNGKKHVRVRPMFQSWSVEGIITVTTDDITDDMVYKMFDIAGKTKGLGDWRPGGKTPGTWGMFTAKVHRI